MPLPLFVSPTIHHEAIDWATRVSANGGTISSSVIRGVSAFCADIDRQGLRDRFARLSIFSGGNLSGALVPLYRSFSYDGTLIGGATDTNVNFVSGNFAESGASAGLTGNGTTKHLNCGASILSQLSVGNAHLSVSGAALNGVSSVNIIGAGGSGFNNLAALQTTPGGTTHRTFINGTPAASTDTSAAFSSGQLIASSVATNDLRLFQNGTQNGSTLTTTRSGSLTANAVFVFAYNDNGTPYTRIASRLTSYSIGRGLTASQAAAFSSALAALNTALGR
jgi:hypothetical protein